MMRRLLAALALIASPLAAQVAAPAAFVPQIVGQSATALPRVEPPAGSLPTKLIWSDEFTAPKLDTTKWPRNGVFRFPGAPGDTTLAAQTGETQRYDPADVLFDPWGGYVHLRIEPDPHAAHIAWDQSLLPLVGKAPYSGQGIPRLFGNLDRAGMIHTYPNYPVVPGSMIELRVFLPTNCKGRWPAAWLFGYPYPSTPNPNASIPFAGQEDDIFEANGLGHLKITLHNSVTPTPTVEVTHPAGWFIVRQWRDQVGKRVYEWIGPDAQHMTLVAVLPTGNDNDLSFPLMLNHAGGTPNWAFIGLPDATTPKVCDFMVDYARVYGK